MLLIIWSTISYLVTNGRMGFSLNAPNPIRKSSVMLAMVLAEREGEHGAQESKNVINKTDEAQFHWCLEFIHCSDIPKIEISNYQQTIEFWDSNVQYYAVHVCRRPIN